MRSLPFFAALFLAFPAAAPRQQAAAA